MVLSKTEYKEYIKADDEANGFCLWKHKFNILRRYLRRLRHTEYLVNCKKSKLRIYLSKYMLNRISVKTGITIGINCFGKGLYLPHYGYIVCNGTARFGDFCTVQCGVNISENVIGGNHIYLGTGAKIMKNVILPNDTIVGANSVVTKQFEKENIVIAGIPGHIISESGFKSRINNI